MKAKTPMLQKITKHFLKSKVNFTITPQEMDDHGVKKDENCQFQMTKLLRD
jgi:hypothetical protein